MDSLILYCPNCHKHDEFTKILVKPSDPEFKIRCLCGWESKEVIRLTSKRIDIVDKSKCCDRCDKGPFDELHTFGMTFLKGISDIGISFKMKGGHTAGNIRQMWYVDICENCKSELFSWLKDWFVMKPVGEE